MATLDSRAYTSTETSAFMQAWPFVADWITAHREAISKYVRALGKLHEMYLKEACFEGWWHERTGSTSSSNSDHFSEATGEVVTPWWSLLFGARTPLAQEER
jgi:hypothetical protein